MTAIDGRSTEEVPCPNCGRLVKLLQTYPQCRFSVLCDHPKAARDLSTALAGANLFLGTNPVGPPVIGTVIVFPLVAAAVAAALSPSVRAVLLGMPMPFLIGLNVWRVAGSFFLFLAAEGRLAGPFPYSAGWGDVITGAAALPVAWLALRQQASPLVWTWNAFGTLDLVVALALGITSANGSPLQLIHAGIGSEAVQILPWSLIPTVLVPLYLITHGIIFARLAHDLRSDGGLLQQPRTAGGLRQ